MATAGLSGAVHDLRALVEEQGKFLESLSEVVKTLVPPAERDGPKPYQIQPSVHWWSIKADGRRKAVEHLRSWVDHVYRPHYGHLAAMLAACWADHELCLVDLDWLSELHSRCTSTSGHRHILTAQAEYHTRILPASAELMRAETSKCPHRPPQRTAAHGEVPDEPAVTAGRGRPPVRRPRLVRVPHGAGLEDPRDRARLPRRDHGPQEIQQWWRSEPNANVAVATGKPGPDVVDVDRKGDRSGFARGTS